MRIEQLQDNLKSSVDHFVSLGKVLNLSYQKLWPSEQGTLMYALLMAGRRLSKYMAQAHRLQDRFIPDITGLNLIETRGELRNLMSYLEQGDCDLDIAYTLRGGAKPIFEPSEIVSEENLDNLFPAKEQAQHYINARKLLIETSKNNYFELIECIKDVNERIDKILDDVKKMKRDEKFRMARLGAMREYYQKNYAENDRTLLLNRIKGEMRDKKNQGVSESNILTDIYLDLLYKNIDCSRDAIKYINQSRHEWEEVARYVAENRSEFNFDGMMSHFKFLEYDRIINNHLTSQWFLSSCDDYQGKLFVNKATFEIAKLIKGAVASYVGFDNKMNAAFLFYAMRDLGLVLAEENNATLMADFMKEVYEEDISADTITRPLRKANGQAFCMIDESNLRSFTNKEFQKYKEPYWRCYSIINKALAIEDVECADYLKQLHPTIASKDVFEKLEENDRSTLYFLSSVLRGDTLLF